LRRRAAAPIFYRAGMPVTMGNTCRTSNTTPVGCGQPMMFGFFASTGAYCCPCAAGTDDVPSGMGLTSATCNGSANCSAAGSNSDGSQRVIIWGR
jgi:hypothetical protein